MSQPRFGRMIPAMVTPFDENRELDLDTVSYTHLTLPTIA